LECCCAGSIGYSILLSAYARVGQIEVVEKLVTEINKRAKGECDILLFNTLLKVYCNAGYMDGVMATLRKMDTEGCTPDRGTFNILIGYFAKEDLYDLALTTLQDMEIRGHRPNEVSQSSSVLLSLFTSLHFTSLKVSGLCIGGLCSSLEALLLPSNLNSPSLMCDQATYNALFQGLVKIDKVDEMWHMFGVMKERGIAPSNLSLHTVISALIVHNRLDDAYTTFLELKASSLYSARRHTHTHTHTYHSFIY
jgi:pentatricopeptide repeat domain-containing protein 1